MDNSTNHIRTYRHTKHNIYGNKETTQMNKSNCCNAKLYILKDDEGVCSQCQEPAITIKRELESE